MDPASASDEIMTKGNPDGIEGKETSSRVEDHAGTQSRRVPPSWYHLKKKTRPDRGQGGGN